ncbi:MAG: hypothetical protein IKA36_05035 [Clostridia bacterium]|nr:hypothetical protein [Clostridia bacterium]
MKKTHLDTRIHMGCRVVNGDIEHNWEPQDLKTFVPPQNKMVFVFGGNSTNRPEAANGNAKVIERLLSEQNKSRVSLFSFIYDSEPISPITRCILGEYETELHEVYKKIFEPQLRDRIGNLKEKQGIEKVLKNMILVSHCGGSNFANIIIDDIYNTLTEKYHPSIAEQLVSKIQYFAYAPNLLSEHKVNGVIITPFTDINHSWVKPINEAREKRVDVDHPRGVIKKILKIEDPFDIQSAFDKIYKEQRMITFKVEQNIFIIPDRLNSDIYVGDHSIDCLTKRGILEADTEFAKNAKLLNYASSLVLNQFVEGCYDNRQVFEKIVSKANKNKISSTQKQQITNNDNNIEFSTDNGVVKF